MSTDQARTHISSLFCLAAIAVTGCTAAAEQEAFRKIKEKGGKIELRGSGPEVVFSNVKITDDDLKCLQGLPHIHKLTLEFADITDQGVDHLLSIGGLNYLTIRRTKVTQAGIAKLKEKFPEIEIRQN